MNRSSFLRNLIGLYGIGSMTVWFSQKQIAMLFGTNVMTADEQIRGVFNDGELDEKAWKQLMSRV